MRTGEAAVNKYPVAFCHQLEEFRMTREPAKSAPSALWPVYIEAFRTCTRGMATENSAPPIEGPGIVGRPGTEQSVEGRLLITDDAAWETLAEYGDPRVSQVVVKATAPRCVDYMRGLPGYLSEPATAMVARDLTGVPDLPLGPGLSLRRAVLDPVADEADLREAAAASLRFDPVGTGQDEIPLDPFVSYLASIPGATLLAAVDTQGQVRATAGSVRFEQEARVFFVAADPELRGGGLGTAMTAAALGAARTRGATRASLDASPMGHGIYRRLGFEDLDPVVLFFNPS
jgi:ribosomal protein S18 acetylase RimI-like enzyme